MRPQLRRFALLPLLPLVVFAFAGCGGSGGGDDDGDTTSIFAGTYVGSYNSSLGDAGSMVVTVSELGEANASVTSTQNLGLQGTVTGTIENDGSFEGSMVFNGTTYTATGELTRDSDGDITGTLNQTNSTTNAVIQVNLSRSNAD